MEADNATEDNDMYGIHRYCPRCGGYRLLKLHGRDVLVICSGCGLMIEEPEPQRPSGGTFGTRTDLKVTVRRERWESELPTGASPPPIKHP
jgi:hypothetical protein